MNYSTTPNDILEQIKGLVTRYNTLVSLDRQISIKKSTRTLFDLLMENEKEKRLGASTSFRERE